MFNVNNEFLGGFLKVVINKLSKEFHQVVKVGYITLNIT